MPRTILALVCTAVALTADPAAAQSSAWGNNGYVSFNGLYDVSTQRYDVTTTEDVNQETQRITTTQTVGKRPVYDVTLGGRLRGRLGMGYGFSYAKSRESATVSGSLPHPFYFDQPRTLDGATSLERSDFDVHIHMMWLVPLTDTFQVTLFGGPSWFNTSQQAVKSVAVSETYPYDTVALESVTLERKKGSTLGFNGGFDASYFFSEKLGVHALVRYSQGSVTFSSAAGRSSVDVGGLQTGAGLRVRF